LAYLLGYRKAKGKIPYGYCNGIKEEMVMKTTVLAVIVLLGIAVPLMWLIGTAISMVYFYLRREGATNKEQAVALHPELGFTMADGGDAIDKKEKK
jgi:hypothetical protein